MFFRSYTNARQLIRLITTVVFRLTADQIDDIIIIIIILIIIILILILILIILLLLLVVYYAKMAANTNMYIKYTQKYKDKKAEMHDKIIEEADIQYNRNAVQI